ncbi:NAD(P)/FAD-dependent oxidoreductase [uncultured Sneathiella sp.]|jgi:cation diffusion facilitator CzcD-associated flavoprotein CzcO|uniref:flavin-containing monooxygenase n=1 Tax=uncultured Sneathiella sp. TaxID=879315 RepID=UPI0030DA7D7B|tara:strand:+ start:8105 stop:9775 length:1671 start_codon:yes stop_codon:yes gene_type:complete
MSIKKDNDMSKLSQRTQTTRSPSADQYDAIIIGAGMAGMYQLHLLRKLGLSVRVFEAGGDVGGTWYWNRYPGARFDSESYSYGYSFSEELLQEWDWSEHFSAQPETLTYLNYVADKFGWRKDIQFNNRVQGAHYVEDGNFWEVEFENGGRARGRYLITAIGPLSAPTMPAIDGVDDYQGEAYHTGLWPHVPVSFEDKRVAVIGTGATGVQTIQEVAKKAGHLTVFQRTPNWCAPLNNSPIDDQTQTKIKASYPEIFARCKDTYTGFLHDSDRRHALEVSLEEREAFYEELYAGPGFGIWVGNFRDVLVDQDANDTISEFVAKKIRERVKAPEIAEKLIPTNHGFGTRRVPMETNYYEVYNQKNVELVDIRETPIERITASGIETCDNNFEFDMIIYATGFDAVTGAFDRIDIRGTGGQTLKDKWVDGPKTYLGLQIEGFPNLLTLVGPHNAATFCNIPRCIEQNVEWVADLMKYMRDGNHERIVPTTAAENAWTEHVYESGQRMLFTKVDSWFMGVNQNVPGKQKRTFLIYAGGAPSYRERCDEIAADDYAGFEIS